MKSGVSVIIPVYNGEHYLAEAIESVLNQSHPAEEILIIDDGSTDDTRAIVKNFGSRTQYIQVPHRGAPAARNEGIRRAGCLCIAFLDSDDLWPKDKLEVQVELLQRHPALQLVTGLTRYFSASRMFEPVITMDFVSSLFRSSVFTEVGLLDENLAWCDDWDWFLRAREKDIPMLIHRHVVRLYRRHERNITNDKQQVNRHLLHVLRRSLTRRRTVDGDSKSLPEISDYLYQTKDSGYDS